MKFSAAVGLVVGTLALLIVASLQFVLVMWVALFGLFLASRFSQGAVFFTEWSWLEFLATIAIALGVPYLVLLLTFGF
jgi:hypothetical protein